MATYRNVLGCLMKNPKLFISYSDIVTDDFIPKVTKIIFANINNLYRKTGIIKMEPIDVDLEIEKHEGSAAIYKAENGLDFLKACYELADESAFDYYYHRLKKLTLIKTLIKKKYDVSYYFRDSKDFNTIKEEDETIERFEEATIEDILNYVEGNYNKIREEFLKGNKNNSNASEGVVELIEEFKKMPEVGPDLEGINFSSATRGARAGKFYLRSGSSGVGKSRLAVFDACKIAYPIHYDLNKECFIREVNSRGEFREARKTLLITTEMDKSEIQTIMVAYLSKVNEENILKGCCSREETERVAYTCKIMEKYKDYFFLEEISDPNLTNVEALIKRYVTIENVKYVFFDYIFTSPSLIAQFSNAKLREDVCLGMLANQLKQLAKDYNIFVSSSTQMNSEGMNKPGFKDEKCLRGARALADKVDVGCCISRVIDEEYNSMSAVLRQAGLDGTISNQSLKRKPNLIFDIYKNRRGKFRGIRIWSYVDLGTGEREDLYMTNQDNTPIENVRDLPDNFIADNGIRIENWKDEL